MAIEDLLLNVGSSVDDSELDSLAGKLETIDTLEDKVDPIDIAVNISGDEEALAELGALETVANDIDDVDIGVGGDTALSTEQVGGIRDDLGDEFDPRGLLRKDLTVEELRTGDMDGPMFETPSKADSDRLIFDETNLQGIENLIDWGSVGDVLDEEGVGGLTGRSDSDQFTDFPGRDSDRDLMDMLLGGRHGIRGERRGGMLRPFSGLQMSQFYNALAQLLPLLFVFIGALPAAIVAIGGLATAALGAAGALAAIGGLGALGFAAIHGDGDLAAGMEELLTTIKQDFLNAFLPLADRFDDVFSDALDGLGELFDAIAAQGDVLVQFKDEARAFGGFIMDFLPTAISLMVQFGDAFSPIFGMFGDWLNMNFDDILGGLADVFSRSLPSLLRFIDAFIAFLPFLIDLSIGFLIASSYVMQFFGAIGNLLGALGPVGTGLGVITGLLLAVGSIVGIVTTLMGLFAGVLTGGVIGALYSAITALYAYLTGTIAATLGTSQLIASLTVLSGGLLLLIGALGVAAWGFSQMSSNIDDATKSLDQFSSARDGFGGGVGGSHTSGLSEGTMSVYQDNSKTVYNGSGGDREKNRRENRRNNYRKKMFSPTQ